MPSRPIFHLCKHYAVIVGITLAWCALATAGSIESPSTEENSVLRLPKRSSREDTSNTHKTERPVLARRTGAASPESDPGRAPLSHARPGPWGDLDYFTVYLEASTAMLKGMEFNTFDTEWNFVGYTDDDLAKLFKSVELPQSVRD